MPRLMMCIAWLGRLCTSYGAGTYNNQYMVVDLNRFTPGEALKEGLLTIVEVIPGQLQTDAKQEKDQPDTHTLHMTHMTRDRCMHMKAWHDCRNRTDVLGKYLHVACVRGVSWTHLAGHIIRDQGRATEQPHAACLRQLLKATSQLLCYLR